MSEPRWMKKVEQGLGRVALHGHRRPGRVLLLAILLTVAGGFLARQLRLNANLVDLLPRSFESVRDVERLQQRFGGIGWMVVVGENGTPEALRRFVDDVAPKLAQLEGIAYVDRRRPGAFFEEKALYYVDGPDLEEIFRRLKARERYEAQKANPLYVELEETAPPSLDFSDIEKKYQGNAARRFSGGHETYYLDAAARRVVILAKPSGNSANLGFSQRLVKEVDGFLKTLDLKQYGPDFRVSTTGTYKKKVDQQAQISRDIATSSALALALLLAYLVFHFRSGVAVILALLPVGAGLAWTYGWVGVGYGQINLLTGFLGAILGGLGIEHGIHLVGRYMALRTEGLESEAATREVFTHTGASALVSASVGALAFFSLALSKFRAFHEFGMIAGVGMVVLVLAYGLVLPALLGTANRWGWKPPPASETRGARSELSRLIPKFRYPLTAILGVLCLLSALNMGRVRFDFDFAALEDQRLGSFVLDKKVNQLLGYSQTPVVVLTDKASDEAQVVAQLRQRKAALKQASSVDFVGALNDLVPHDQVAKQETLKKIEGVLSRVNPERLDPALRERVALLQRQVQATPFDRAALPESVRRQFSGPNAAGGGAVLVYPSISLADGARVRDFAREVRSLNLESGAKVSAAGEAMVLADILEMVSAEGPLILSGALVAVLLAMWLTLGSVREALLCLTPTLVPMVALVGLMPVMGLRFNYLNILVLPVLVGVTVDAGVHLLGRLGGASVPDFSRVYAETARAVCGGLLTSAVGFGALMLADHPGLNSIGTLANLGFATNLIIMVLGFPALLLVLQRRRNADFVALTPAPPAPSLSTSTLGAGNEGLEQP